MLELPALATFVEQLRTSLTFEEAATALLKAMANAASRSKANEKEHAHSYNRRLLRIVVHLRPDDGYRRLFGIECATGQELAGTGYFTSANVWRWVAKHRAAVSIDLKLGTLRAHLADGPVQGRETPDISPLPGSDTLDQMTSRDVSHVHVVPVHGIGDLNGMILLEAQCDYAAGRAEVWEDCREKLALLAGIGAPYLTLLPSHGGAKVATDELLPVVGRSTAHVVELLQIFARQEETVLISGPTGAGKSRLARWCHERSGRKVFETLDLLSVPEELQMAELFGWRKGAFTNAVKDSAGAIARADGGTLFIDEIDKLSLKAQAGLLRVLEERKYRPIGDEGRERVANVRFIVGTNADLRASVKARTFREDLYYRINVLPVRLPALAERTDELPLWANYMLSRRHKDAGEQKGAVSFSPEALEVLVRAPWPGNLRQLDNIVRRAYAIALSEHGRTIGDLAISRLQVERALAYEHPADQSDVIEKLWRAAQAFVGEAVRRESQPNSLSVEMLDVIKGMAFAAATTHRGGRDEAFLLLGQQQLVKSRNHNRAYKREIARVRELVALLGADVPQDLASILDEPNE